MQFPRYSYLFSLSLRDAGALGSSVSLAARPILRSPRTCLSRSEIHRHPIERAAYTPLCRPHSSSAFPDRYRVAKFIETPFPSISSSKVWSNLVVGQYISTWDSLRTAIDTDLVRKRSDKRWTAERFFRDLRGCATRIARKKKIRPSIMSLYISLNLSRFLHSSAFLLLALSQVNDTVKRHFRV